MLQFSVYLAFNHASVRFSKTQRANFVRFSKARLHTFVRFSKIFQKNNLPCPQKTQLYYTFLHELSPKRYTFLHELLPKLFLSDLQSIVFRQKIINAEDCIVIGKSVIW